MNSREPILEICNVTKKFPGVTALDKVCLQLYSKEILAVIGENGAGKSTLMKILSGSYSGYSGEIFISGKLHCCDTIKNSEKAGIAMIYQELNLELDLSVAENIYLGIPPRTRLGFVDWETMNEEAKKILDRLGLRISPKSDVRNLNASQQQIVSIARALVRNPAILILDEPTASLTEEEANNLIRLINELKESGISCIYISHKLDEVFSISDRIVVMRDGKYVSEYEKSEIVPSKVIEDMVGRKLDKMYPVSNRKMGEEVLRVENLQVAHPQAVQKKIIDDISFSVKKGEILGLAGLVGSGRSELLRATYGAMAKAKGRIYVDGNEVKINKPSDGIQHGIGFLTEERKNDGYVGSMSVKENMTLTILKEISNLGFIKRNDEKSHADQYFKYLQIKATSLDQNIMTLSGGNQQKVILAKSLMANSKILFLDEPTRGVDVGTKAEIYKIMEDLVEKGLSIVMISSELPELIAMCDRFIVIGRGKVLGEFDKSEVNEKVIIHTASQIGLE